MKLWGGLGGERNHYRSWWRVSQFTSEKGSAGCRFFRPSSDLEKKKKSKGGQPDLGEQIGEGSEPGTFCWLSLVLVVKYCGGG